MEQLSFPRVSGDEPTTSPVVAFALTVFPA